MSSQNPGPADISSLPMFAPAPAEPNIERAAGHLTRAGQKTAAAAYISPPTATTPPAAPPTRTEVTPAPLSAPGATLEQRSNLPWAEVAEIRDDVSRELAALFSEDLGIDPVQRETTAREHIADRVRARVDEQTRHDGQRRWEEDTQHAIQQAVFDQLFRLGRLQPLVDEEGVENIRINGFDNVWLLYNDGRKVKYPYPIASDDRDLERQINFLAARTGEGGRAFTSANPRLRMDLSGQARLSAIAANTSVRPAIVIRIHRHVDVTLDELIELGTLTPVSAQFLQAAVQAGVSIVISGWGGAGKTTLLRALARTIDPMENLVIIEKVRELHLEDSATRPLWFSFEARDGEGEMNAEGRKPGEITVDDLVVDSLTLDTQRQIVGEVLGTEIQAMMTAMQSGVGSLSTIHSSSADEAIERISALMLSRGRNNTPTFAYKMIELNIGLIVQITRIRDPRTGKPRRVVTEIAELRRGEQANDWRPTITDLFRFDADSGQLVLEAVPGPRLLPRLAEHGYVDAAQRPGYGGEQ